MKQSRIAGVLIAMILACSVVMACSSTYTSRSDQKHEQVSHSVLPRTQVLDRLKEPNSYVMLSAVFPDGQTREIVLYTEVIPFVLSQAGALKGNTRTYPALLSDADISALVSAPIVFTRPLAQLSIDSAPDQSCPLGGVVDRSIEGIWSSKHGLTVDEILDDYFSARPQDVNAYELKPHLIGMLTCADIASLLSFNLSIKRSLGWDTIVVRKRPN